MAAGKPRHLLQNSLERATYRRACDLGDIATGPHQVFATTVSNPILTRGTDYAHPISTRKCPHQGLKDTGAPNTYLLKIWYHLLNNYFSITFKTICKSIREIKFHHFFLRWWEETNHHFRYYLDIFLTYFSHEAEKNYYKDQRAFDMYWFCKQRRTMQYNFSKVARFQRKFLRFVYIFREIWQNWEFVKLDFL